MAAAHRSRRPAGALVFRLALLAALAQAICAKAAAEKPAGPLEIDVSSGSMASVLLAIGQRYSVIMSFMPSLVEGQKAMPVRGRYTLGEALELALHNSELAADIAPEGVVTLQRAARAAQPVAVKPVAEAERSLVEVAPPESVAPSALPSLALPAVIVEARAERSSRSSDMPESGFLATTSDAATLSDTPLSQLPQSVSVMTRDGLEATNAQTQIDAMGFATGVSAYSSSAGSSPAKVRGFPAQYTLSGLSSFRSGLPLDSAAIERLEIIKGPSGVIGGVAGEEGRGGVINIVRKRPYPGQKPEATLSVDSHDGGTVRSIVDLGAGEGETLWRFVGYGSHSNRTDAGYAPRHGDGVLGSVSHRGADLSVTLSFQREQRRDVFPEMAGTQSSEDSTELTISNDRKSIVDRKDGTGSRISDAEVDAEWRLSSNWRMRARARWERVGLDGAQHDYDSEQGTVTMERDIAQAKGRAWRWSLLGDVQTGPVKHKLLLGVDMQTSLARYRYGYADWNVDPAEFAPGQTMLSPTPDSGSLEPEDLGEIRFSQRGLLLQDQLRLGDLSLRLAMRRARFSTAYYSPEESKLGGRNWDVGACFQLLPSMTVYAGAQASIEANLYAGGELFDGTAAPPGRSQQQQVGAKFDLFDGRLALTLEAYRLRQRNVVNFDAQFSGGSQAYLVPGKSSKGLELEIVGRPSAALDVSLGMNLIRARELQGATQQVDPYAVPATAVPERSMHLLANYRLPESVALGTSVGLALRAHSSTWAEAPSTEALWESLRVPGGAQLDLSWMRRGDHWSFGMSVFNVFDRRLYGPTVETDRVPLLPGRSFGVKLSYRG